MRDRLGGRSAQTRVLRHDLPEWNATLPPAPGNLAIVQAFINTLDLEAQSDELADPSAAIGWLKRWGLVAPDADAALDIADLVSFRETLRSLLEAHHESNAEAAATELSQIATNLPLNLSFDGHGRVSFVPSDAPDPRTRILAIIAAAELDDLWRRLKVCTNDECRWAFYDHSRNMAGKWCAMRRCGTLMNVRAYRQRRRSQGGPDAARAH